MYSALVSIIRRSE